MFSINTMSEINEEFIDLFVNELPCSDEFNKYINDEDLLQNDFLFNQKEAEILKTIFFTYCSGSSQEIVNIISQKIFSDEIKKKSLLYSIHSSKFAFHLSNSDSLEIAEIMINELSLLNSIDTDELGSAIDIANLIYNVSAGINQFELSEFNENLEKTTLDYGANTNLMYSLIERFIFDIIDYTFPEDSLTSIAQTLFDIRIAKSNNLNYYGSPLERFSARDELIKIYLANYSNGEIKYFEFSNLIKSKGGNSPSDFIFIKPTLDQISSLNTISTSYFKNTYSEEGYQNKSDQIFDRTMQQMIIERFDENPDEIIDSISARLFNNASNIDCSLSKKTYKPEDNSFEKFATELKFLSYKLKCLDNQELLFNLLDKLRIYYKKIDQENLSGEDLSDALLEVNLVSMFLDLHISTGTKKINFSEIKLDLFIEKFISLKELQISVDKINKIRSYENIISIITLTQSFDLISEFVLDDKSDYVPRLDALEKSVYDQIYFDEEALKIFLLSDKTSKSDKIFTSKYLSMVGLNLVNSVSNFVPEYLDILVDDYKKGIDKKRNEQINQYLRIISFYLDNINEIHRSTTPEFIFKVQPLDKWFVFKDLISFEITLNFVQYAAGLMSFEEYYKIAKKRIDQILFLRPETISLEKFKSVFIEENKSLEYINTVIKYDQIQKDYKELFESKIILNKDVFDLSSEDRSSMEFNLKSELLSLQEVLFEKENRGILFQHDTIKDNDIHDFLDNDEAILSFLSGEFFSIGVMYKRGMTYLMPLSLSRTGFNNMSGIIKNSFSDPNQPLPYKELSKLREIFINGFDLEGIKSLYIVTDEIFSGFPFHSLYKESTKKWIIDEYNVSYLSGEKLLLYLDKRKISKKDSFLGFANPVLNKSNLENQIEEFFSERGDLAIEKISQLNELPETEKELLNISKYFKNSSLYFQNNATENNLFNNASNKFDFIAFATHSVSGLSKFYNDRGLVLTPINSDLHNNDGFLSSGEIKTLNLDTNPTILLTACNTIESQYYLALPYSGLASSFMEAGANGVLLSLWNVNNESSSELNQGIFKNRKDLYFSEALRDSIINLKSKEKYSHPYYWAPYIYLGR